MSIFITAYKTRTTTEEITFLDADGAAITLGASDKVRVKIGRQLATPDLDVASDAALAGGTSVTAANPARLVLDQDDLSGLTPGMYDVEAAVVDAGDGNRLKHAEMGVMCLIGTQGGGVT